MHCWSTPAEDGPDELIFAACAALYSNTNEKSLRRLCHEVDLAPSSVQQYVGEPYVEAAFTAFLRHPFSTEAVADDARKIGRKNFFALAVTHMRSYIPHLSGRAPGCPGAAQIRVETPDLQATRSTARQSAARDASKSGDDTSEECIW